MKIKIILIWLFIFILYPGNCFQNFCLVEIRNDICIVDGAESQYQIHIGTEYPSTWENDFSLRCAAEAVEIEYTSEIAIPYVER